MARRSRRDGDLLGDDLETGASLVRRERLIKSVEGYTADTAARLKEIEGVVDVNTYGQVRADGEGRLRAQVRFDIEAPPALRTPSLRDAIGRALAAEAPEGVFIHYRVLEPKL